MTDAFGATGTSAVTVGSGAAGEVVRIALTAGVAGLTDGDFDGAGPATSGVAGGAGRAGATCGGRTSTGGPVAVRDVHAGLDRTDDAAGGADDPGGAAGAICDGAGAAPSGTVASALGVEPGLASVFVDAVGAAAWGLAGTSGTARGSASSTFGAAGGGAGSLDRGGAGDGAGDTVAFEARRFAISLGITGEAVVAVVSGSRTESEAARVVSATVVDGDVAVGVTTGVAGSSSFGRSAEVRFPRVGAAVAIFGSDGGAWRRAGAGVGGATGSSPLGGFRSATLPGSEMSEPGERKTSRITVAGASRARTITPTNARCATSEHASQPVRRR